MPRKPRFALPGMPQHVIQRGNNREPCFFAEDDYRHYLDLLKEASDRNRCHIHAYVLMTNHVHVLATPSTAYRISHMMQDLGRKYVRHINGVYRRSGTLWEGRFKASLVGSDAYLLTCMRYIELNPVRSGMVRHPGEHPWSSYRANALGEPDTLVAPHALFQSLDTARAGRQRTYRELFRAHLEPGEAHAIRVALNQPLVLGRDDFKDRIERMTQRRARPGKPGRPRTRESAVPASDA